MAGVQAIKVGALSSQSADVTIFFPGDANALQAALAAWSSAGQMSTRFEVARTIGSGPAGLFKTEATPPVEKPAFPQLSNALYHQGLAPSLSPRTRQALEQATSPQEWNTFLLSSPEFMNR